MPISRQRRWQKKKLLLNLCQSCGMFRLETKTLCHRCRERARGRLQRRLGGLRSAEPEAQRRLVQRCLDVVEQYQHRLDDLDAIGFSRNDAEVRTLKAELKVKLKEETAREVEQAEQGITERSWQEEREEQARLRALPDPDEDDDSDREDEKQHSRQFQARHAYRKRALRTIGLKAEWAQLKEGKREPGGSFAMWHWVKMTPAMRLVFHAHLHFRDHRTDQSRATRRQVAHLTMMHPTNVSHALKQIVALGLPSGSTRGELRASIARHVQELAADNEARAKSKRHYSPLERAALEEAFVKQKFGFGG